jgi:hypothetical protein
MPAPVLWAALALAAAGCEAQADTSYRGEPLARLSGVIRSSIDDPPGPIVALLAWHNSANQGGDLNVLEEAQVEAEFPARFRVDLFRPPGEGALNDYTHGGERPREVRIGVAHIAAWPDGFEPDGEEGPEIFGVAEHQLLVYVERDVLPDTFSAELLRGELTAGFHLMDVIENGEPGCVDELFDCMVPAPDDLDTPIEIRLDQADLLDFPDWT